MSGVLNGVRRVLLGSRVEAFVAGDFGWLVGWCGGLKKLCDLIDWIEKVGIEFEAQLETAVKLIGFGGQVIWLFGSRDRSKFLADDESRKKFDTL